MPSTEKTPYYNLSQFKDYPQDKFTTMGDYSRDMLIIDGALKHHDDEFVTFGVNLGTKVGLDQLNTILEDYAKLTDLDPLATQDDLSALEANIQTKLDGKANTVHTHTSTQITDFTPAVSAIAQALIDDIPAPPPSNVVLQGTYASRPYASSVSANTTFYATDVPETYVSNGTDWRVVGSGGNELGYAQSTTEFIPTAAAGTYVSVPGMSITFKVGERPIELSMSAVFGNAQAGGFTGARFLVDGTDAYAVTIIEIATVGQNTTASRSIKVSGLAPGTDHTVVLQVASLHGQGRFSGGATSPGMLSVVTR